MHGRILDILILGSVNRSGQLDEIFVHLETGASMKYYTFIVHARNSNRNSNHTNTSGYE